MPFQPPCFAPEFFFDADVLRIVQGVMDSQMEIKSVLMQLGDVLIRHPWALHRGTPNLTDTPRTLCTNQPQLSMGLLSSADMLNQQRKEGPTIDHDNVVIASQSF